MLFGTFAVDAVVCNGDPNKTCCNNECCNNKCCNDECCYDKTCYDPNKKRCCEDGNGHTCDINETCCNGQCCNPKKCEDCNDVTGTCESRCKPENCETCLDLDGDGTSSCEVCGGDPTKCCVEGECKNYCGLSCPCREDQYCCGSSLPLPGAGECCNPDEVCCYTDTSGFFCRPPCEIYPVDCTTCAKSHEDDYKCPGCLPFPSGYGCLCFTYREYTGLVIQGCEYGCRHDTGYEPCYRERRCVDHGVEEAALCILFEDNKLRCVPDLDSEGEDGTPIIGCDECDTGGGVVYTYNRYTCRNCFDY